MTEQPAGNAASSDSGFGLPEGHSFAIYQLAKILCCDRKHLVNLCESGVIKVAIDIRGAKSSQSCIRIPRESIIEFLQSRQVQVPVTTGKLARRGDKSAGGRIRKH